MTDDAWWDGDSSAETPADTVARGGSLSPHGRESAIRDALPIIGRFFQQQGSAERLATTNNISVQDGQLKATDFRLLAALRLRSALAAATPILSAIQGVAVRPTFRYALQSAESVGYLAGTLDVPRYASRAYWDGGPPTYPVTNVYRSSLTPENVLTAYSALWMQHELREALEVCDAPPRAPETQAATELDGNFEQLLSSPALADCRSAAADVLRRGAEGALLDDVQARLRRGEVAHAEPYQDVLDAMRHLREAGPTGLPGTQAWSFYDEAFDTRLFELWCAFSVATSVSAALATEVPAVDPDWSGTGLTFTWRRPSGTLELYMQKSLHLVDDTKQRRWRLKGTDTFLRGIPDIVMRGVTHEGISRWAILDAKLRQRSGPPSEELYKVLGYFGHYILEHDAQGAILFYAPELSEPNVRVYVPDPADAGSLIATALNPSDRQQSMDGLAEVTDMALSLLSMPPAQVSDPSLSAGEAYVARLVEEMRTTQAQIVPASLDASRRRLSALLGNDVWERLDGDCRDMLATAENVGFTLDQAGGDFSGPVLSLVAPLEVLVHEQLWLPATEGLSRRDRENRQTLGQVIDAVIGALNGQETPLGDAIRQEVQRRTLSVPTLRLSLDALSGVNRDFRRRAAHKEKLTSQDWNVAFRRVIAQDRVLPELLEALGVHSSSASTEAPGTGEAPQPQSAGSPPG